MLKIIEKESENNIVEMKDMKPLQIGIIQNGDYKNVVVMRTASYATFEVMNLSKPEVNSYWNSNSTLPVKLLYKNEKIIIELFNE